MAIQVRSSSNSEHSDAVRLSIRSSGPNSESSELVDQHADDYVISPPMSENGEDTAQHIAHLASSLNNALSISSDTPWLSPAMPQVHFPAFPDYTSPRSYIVDQRASESTKLTAAAQGKTRRCLAPLKPVFHLRTPY